MNGRMPFRTVACLWVSLALFAPTSRCASSPGAEEDIVINAMRDEIARSLKKLRLEGEPKPYFISYFLRKTSTTGATATFGSLTSSGEHQTRLLTVTVRVGDYTLDNTNFFSMPFGPSGVVDLFAGSIQVPLEDDYKEIRRQLWLATDAAYKKALEDFSKKRAVLQTQTRAEDLPDFSREEPVTITDRMEPVKIKLREAEALVRELSACFKQMPQVFTSSVQLEALNHEISYVNSEGTLFTRLEPGVLFTALAQTQAADGMPLEDFVSAYGRSMEDLPDRVELARQIREMGTSIKKLREAPLVDPYTGPVLIEGQAAAELFSRVFVPKLLAVRRSVSDNPQLAMFFSQLEDTFLDKIGARVLPESLTVIDNPLLEEFGHSRLVGGYRIDQEGVPARETRVVEKGILKTLLATRDPVPGIMRSSGNNQGGSAPTPSNIVVSAEKGLNSEEMKAELLRLVKQGGKKYGIIVARVANPILLPSASRMMSAFLPSGMKGAQGEPVILASKVFLDGHEDLVRSAEVSGLTAEAFRNVVAVSKNQTVYSGPFMAPSGLAGFFSGGNAGQPGAAILSYVVPSFLFDSLTLKKPSSDIPKPPVASHPYFAK